MPVVATAIQHPIQFGIAGIITGGFVLVFLRAAMPPERRSGSIGWVHALTGPRTRYLSAFLAVARGVTSPAQPARRAPGRRGGTGAGRP